MDNDPTYSNVRVSKIDLGMNNSNPVFDIYIMDGAEEITLHMGITNENMRAKVFNLLLLDKPLDIWTTNKDSDEIQRVLVDFS